MVDRSQKNALISAVLATLLAVGNSSFVESPIDTEVKVGDSTYLNCSTSDASRGIYWYHYSVGDGTTNQKYIYYQGRLLEPYDSRCHIDKVSSAGSFNLVIIKTELKDAGVYVCQDGETDSTAIAQLIVLETDPLCESNITPNGFIGPNNCSLEQESMQLSCSINFKGNITPKLKWNIVAFGVVTVFKNASNCWVSKSAGSERFVCTVTVETNIELDGVYFICQISKSAKEQYQCRTDDVIIHYSIGDAFPKENAVGDSLLCSAKTNSHKCHYQWIRFIGATEETASSNNSLLITKRGRYQCKATCIIRDIECPLVVTNIDVFTETAAATVRIIVGSFTAVFILAFGLLTFIHQCFCRTHYATTKCCRKVCDDGNFSYKSKIDDFGITKGENEAVISGLAVLRNNLYVVHKNSEVVFVYDFKNLHSVITFDIAHYLALNNPLDITASEVSECLYVADLLDNKFQCQIKRLNVTTKAMDIWSTVDSECRLSAFASSVIVCLSTKNEIREYSSEEGNLVFTVKLLPSDGFQELWHVIKITDSQYAVSHSTPQYGEHRVSIIKTASMSNGQFSFITTYSTTPETCGMHIPICLDQFDQHNIIVADKLNNRVLLIDTTTNSCEIILMDGRITNVPKTTEFCLGGHPIRVWFDKIRRKLFVAVDDSYMNYETCSTSIHQRKHDSRSPVQSNSLKTSIKRSKKRM